MSLEQMQDPSSQQELYRPRINKEKLSQETLTVGICPQCGEPVISGGHNCGDFQKLVTENPTRNDFKKLLDESRSIWENDHSKTNENDSPRNLSIRITEELNRTLNDARDIGSIRPEKRDVPPSE